MSLIENIQRDDLDSIDIAICYKRLIEDINLTQEELGKKIGKKRSTISNYLRLLKLNPIIQSGIKDNFISMLLAFNIGVEFGQLAVLLLAFILIKLIMKKNWYSNEIKIPASLIIAAIGLFWFIERII